MLETIDQRDIRNDNLVAIDSSETSIAQRLFKYKKSEKRETKCATNYSNTPLMIAIEWNRLLLYIRQLEHFIVILEAKVIVSPFHTCMTFVMFLFFHFPISCYSSLSSPFNQSTTFLVPKSIIGRKCLGNQTFFYVQY